MRFLGSRTGAYRIATGLWMALALALSPQMAAAQEAVEPTSAAAAQNAPDAPIDEAAAQAGTEAVAATQPESETAETAASAAGGYTPMAPEPGKGQPIAGGINVQDQYSPIGHVANSLHIGLFWVMVVISVLVLVLLLWVIVRFNKRANPVPSKTSHNTLIEVVWTVVPAFVLLGIAIPSIGLLAKQYETPPKDAITVKATGYQWYWGYTYPDNGDFEVISNMLSEEDAKASGEPHQLAVDNRMVVPVGVPIRFQTTAADVIHSFAVPSLWFKLDAVPGRLNEKILQIDEPGVYYGQCSELCGARHGYMPIAVEALPMDQFNAWVLAQGGTIAGADDAAPAATDEDATDGAPAAAPAPAA